jgi:hypothetical protein
MRGEPNAVIGVVMQNAARQLSATQDSHRKPSQQRGFADRGRSQGAHDAEPLVGLGPFIKTCRHGESEWMSRESLSPFEKGGRGGICSHLHCARC